MLYLILLASLISQSQLVIAQNGSIITNDTYFYGESPLVPPPAGTGAGNWSAAYGKAKAFVAQLSLDEKVNFTAGYSGDNGCSGNIPPLTRLGFPGMCLQDSGNSVRATDFVDGWPSGLHIGASWNKSLAYARGYGIGGEFRTKGVNVLLGPVISPLGRMAEGGRNWEGFSNDPYLCGALVGPTVAAMQSTGVITSTKHFIAYEQETNRNPNNNNTVQSVSSNLDDQTMHEIYLWPFQEAVLAGSGNIMCSYNRINNSYASQNSKTLNGILKTELGYQGFVVSDWGAQHTGVASAISGLDMAMPNSPYWGGNLSEAVTNGSVPEWRLDDMVTRIMAAWYQMGQDSPDFPTPGIGMPANLLAPHPVVNARNPASKPFLFEGAIEGHVLVKNTNNALPLKKPELLSLYGYDAIVPSQYGPSSGLDPWSGGSEGINASMLVCAYTVGVGCGTVPQIALNTMWSGAGSGATTPPYISAPFDAILQYSIENDINLFWDFTNTNSTGSVDGATDACLVFINAFATEGFDRSGLHDDYSDALVENIAAQCANTIVVIHNAGIRLVDQWIENPNVTAVIMAHLPGQDSGRALVEILFGMVSPSGKLPYTVAKNESDYGPLLAPDLPEGIFVDFPQSNFTEGLYIDYKRFDELNIEPRYEFGFGLTYTTFEYSSLNAQVLQPGCSQYPSGQIVPGGPTDLWDVVAKVTAQVQNTGSVAAAEIAQLYIGLPGSQPAKQLRGFDKVMIQPGQTVQVEFDLRRKDLSAWDVVAQQWSLQRGTYQLYVGASSRNLPLTDMLSF